MLKTLLPPGILSLLDTTGGERATTAALPILAESTYSLSSLSVSVFASYVLQGLMKPTA